MVWDQYPKGGVDTVRFIVREVLILGQNYWQFKKELSVCLADKGKIAIWRLL